MRAVLIAILALGLVSWGIWLGAERVPSRVETRYGQVIHETSSSYSHILVRERGTVRSLLFTDESGRERCQSSIDLAAPESMQLGYMRSLFTSFLFRFPQERVLIVGLGGGGMVRYLEAASPETKIEAVEIDPVVVQLAQQYFQIKEGPQVTLHTADAFTFFSEKDPGLYDAIYLDAFLRAPDASERDPTTERLKTEDFLISLREHLVPGGVVAFNLIVTDPRTPTDLDTIEKVFPGMTQFTVPNTGNLVVIAPREGPAPTLEELRQIVAGWEGAPILGLDLGHLAEQRVAP